MSKPSIVKNIITFDISILNNPICYAFLIYNINLKNIDKIKYIKRSNKITFLNKEKIGKFIGSFYNKEKKFHIYSNTIHDFNNKPNQIIFLPKTQINFPIYINSLKTCISSKILYKHLP